MFSNHRIWSTRPKQSSSDTIGISSKCRIFRIGVLRNRFLPIFRIKEMQKITWSFGRKSLMSTSFSTLFSSQLFDHVSQSGDFAFIFRRFWTKIMPASKRSSSVSTAARIGIILLFFVAIIQETMSFSLVRLSVWYSHFSWNFRKKW